MRKRKQRALNFLLVLAMVFSMFPSHVVMAGDTEIATYGTAAQNYDAAVNEFWSAITAYCGNSEQDIPGALPVYEQAAADNADNVQELYEQALAAKATCEEKYVSLTTAYGAIEDAYNKLSEEEQAANASNYLTDIVGGYNSAINDYNDLAEPTAPGTNTGGAELSAIWISPEGYLDGNSSLGEYWKINDAGNLIDATADDYSLRIEQTGTGIQITLRNFNFTSAPTENDISAFFSEIPVTLVLEGTNAIVGTKGGAFGVNGDLTITGTGTLDLISTCGEITAGDGNTYTPLALSVSGKFSNTAQIFCDSQNTEATVNIDKTAAEISNAGTVSVPEGQFIGTMDGRCAKLVKPVSYSSSADYPVPTDHVYVAKAYYYTNDWSYPNNIYDFGNDTTQWRVIGKYDENGNPIPSKVWYQYWFVDERGGMLTEDIVNPVKFLVYDENPESLIQDKDVVAVEDGEQHTFNADLYSLWFTCGDITVNGDVIKDLACFNVRAVETRDPSEGFQHVIWQDGSPVWWVESTNDSKVTVNGNVGLVSLNDSYIGDVTVNGNVDLIGFYEDMDPSVTTTLSFVPETFYGSKANAGDVIVDGEFAKGIESLQGYMGYCVYNTEDFYVRTMRDVQGEAVQGTVAAIEGDALLVDVTRSVIGNNTFPCVKNTDDTVIKQVQGLLTNKDSKLTVMDISLIQDNKAKIEPVTTVNLHIDNLSGFTRPALYHIKDNGEVEKLFACDGSTKFGGEIHCATNSFSTYFVAEDQELQKDNLGTGSLTGGNTTAGNTTPAQTGNQNMQLVSPKTGDRTCSMDSFLFMGTGVFLLVSYVYKRRTYIS